MSVFFKKKAVVKKHIIAVVTASLCACETCGLAVRTSSDIALLECKQGFPLPQQH